jgi:ketosteroid isomerase-like protein
MPPTSVKKTIYASAQDAEAAFYEAFGKSDLEAMMSVWADDDEIYCVHPGGSRISGVEKVRESWRRLFTNGQTLAFQLHAHHEIHGMMIAVHSVYEQITVAGEGPARNPMLATNIYLRTDHGWRMVAHHASPAPAAPAAASTAEPEAKRTPKTLH